MMNALAKGMSSKILNLAFGVAMVGCRTKNVRVESDFEAVIALLRAEERKSGHWPNSLREATVKGGVPLPIDPWGEVYRANRIDGGYLIESSGPNKIAGDADDHRRVFSIEKK